MSKSVNSPLGTVLMLDAPDEIRRKVRKAVTDTDGEVRYDPEAKPGLSNLLELLAVATDRHPDGGGRLLRALRRSEGRRGRGPDRAAPTGPGAPGGPGRRPGRGDRPAGHGGGQGPGGGLGHLRGGRPRPSGCSARAELAGGRRSGRRRSPDAGAWPRPASITTQQDQTAPATADTDQPHHGRRGGRERRPGSPPARGAPTAWMTPALDHRDGPGRPEAAPPDPGGTVWTVARQPVAPRLAALEHDAADVACTVICWSPSSSGAAAVTELPAGPDRRPGTVTQAQPRAPVVVEDAEASRCVPVNVQWGGVTPYCIRPSRATAPASAVTRGRDAHREPVVPSTATTIRPAAAGRRRQGHLNGPVAAGAPR